MATEYRRKVVVRGGVEYRVSDTDGQYRNARGVVLAKNHVDAFFSSDGSSGGSKSPEQFMPSSLGEDPGLEEQWSSGYYPIGLPYGVVFIPHLVGGGRRKVCIKINLQFF